MTSRATKLIVIVSRLVAIWLLARQVSRGFPRILEFEVIPGEAGQRLIVNELIYPGPINAGFF